MHRALHWCSSHAAPSWMESGGKGSFQAVKLQRPARATSCSHSARDMPATPSIEARGHSNGVRFDHLSGCAQFNAESSKIHHPNQSCNSLVARIPSSILSVLMRAAIAPFFHDPFCAGKPLRSWLVLPRTGEHPYGNYLDRSSSCLFARRRPGIFPLSQELATSPCRKDNAGLQLLKISQMQSGKQMKSSSANEVAASPSLTVKFRAP